MLTRGDIAGPWWPRSAGIPIEPGIVMDISGPRWPPLAQVPSEPDAPGDIGRPSWPPIVLSAGFADGAAVSALVTDYQAVRKIALALAALGFFLGLARLGMSEYPAERHRAEILVALTAAVFLVLIGDRMIVRGVAAWFNIPGSSLPAFWQ